MKSGFAVAVVLTGRARAPEAIERRIVALSDPDEPRSKQPYHDGFYQTEEDPAEIARRVKIVERCARQSIDTLVKTRPASGIRAALVVGSVIDPATVGNPHIRAHANEGRLFRTVLEAALRGHGIACSVVVEKTLGAQALKTLGRSDGQIRKTVAALGSGLQGPWRAEEKAAATAAWMVLSR